MSRNGADTCTILTNNKQTKDTASKGLCLLLKSITMSIYKSIELPKNEAGKFIMSKEAITVMKKALRVTFEKENYNSKSSHDYDVHVRCSYQAKVEGETEKVDVHTTFVVNGYWNNPPEFCAAFYEENLFFPDLLKEGQEITVRCNRNSIWLNGKRHEELVRDEIKLCVNPDSKTPKEILLDVRTGSRYEYGLLATKEKRPEVEVIPEPLQIANGE